jgi:hypothetical protein
MARAVRSSKRKRKLVEAEEGHHHRSIKRHKKKRRSGGRSSSRRHRPAKSRASKKPVRRRRASSKKTKKPKKKMAGGGVVKRRSRRGVAKGKVATRRSTRKIPVEGLSGAGVDGRYPVPAKEILQHDILNWRPDSDQDLNSTKILMFTKKIPKNSMIR